VATLQALGLLPIIGAQGTDCADLFVPFAPTSDDLLCSLVDLALPFLLGGLTGGLIGPGLLAFLDQRVECRLLFLQGSFGGRNVEGLIGVNRRVIG
jgi:hypothetical protein